MLLESLTWHTSSFLFSTVHYLAACFSVLHNIGRKLASMPASEINGLSPKTSTRPPSLTPRKIKSVIQLGKIGLY